MDKKEETSIKDIVQQFGGVLNYLLNRWFRILIVAMLGALIGFIYAYFQPVKYESRLTFVLEESKGGIGGIASLAGQFGIDLSGSSGGGIFSGDNVLLFLKSESLVRETLLTQYNQEQKTLADQYITSYNLKSKWAKKENVGDVNFWPQRTTGLSRINDSLLQIITSQVIKSELSVGRPDKKASFVEVKATMRDEALSKLFGDRLVSIALDRYVTSKIKVKDINVKILQRRADSLERLLNTRTYNAASSQQTLIDINPGLRTASAAPEIKNREKMTIAAIFTEVVKNLELAKTILNQETPAIELVDQSSFPLKKEKTSKILMMVVFGVGFGLMSIIYILINKWWSVQMA